MMEKGSRRIKPEEIELLRHGQSRLIEIDDELAERGFTAGGVGRSGRGEEVREGWGGELTYHE
jgi:hypothetical protein